MRSVLLVVGRKLRTTSLEANVAGMTTGLIIDKMIRSVPVMEIVGDLMVGLVRILVAVDLVVILPHGGLVMRSLWSMILDVILGAQGVTGILVEVQALQRGDPLPVVALQPREILGQQRILAKAVHPLNGAQSTPTARGP